MLAEYAVQEISSGRRYPELPHPYRNDFQRDRDRVIHSRAFRRLEAKTQVFTRRHSDHFRNRLTHTIEVAQIARTVAAQLNLNVDLVEALALVHDVGHPPFGHAGEKALDAAMRAHGFFFDHNLHALRIVEDFEMRYASHRGLNLTFEVREGIVKHSREYNADEFPELAEYQLHLRPSLEAQLIDIADEIAYISADMDDGFEARMLKLDDIRENSALFAQLFAEVDQLFPAAPDKLKFNETLKKVVDTLVGDLIYNSRKLITESGARILQNVRLFPHRLISFSSPVNTQRREIKAFLLEHLYLSPSLDSDKADAEKIIAEMFTFWVDHPENLPRNYQDKATREPLPRVVCDYVAGMTDPYIYQRYESTFG